MEINYRHRYSPSSDRFLSLFSPPSPSPNSVFSSTDTNELHESDFFFSKSSESTHSSHSPLPRRNPNLLLLPSKSSTPSRSIPKPSHHRVTSTTTESTQSAPMAVPIMMRRKPSVTSSPFECCDDDDDDDDEEELTLPPHEMVARKLKTTSSVLEGVGRTLKGRDLRQVRNAVWSQTGFLD